MSWIDIVQNVVTALSVWALSKMLERIHRQYAQLEARVATAEEALQGLARMVFEEGSEDE